MNIWQNKTRSWPEKALAGVITSYSIHYTKLYDFGLPAEQYAVQTGQHQRPRGRQRRNNFV